MNIEVTDSHFSNFFFKIIERINNEYLTIIMILHAR